jgi:hypothetical protein
MSRVLVVANETLCADELQRVARTRGEAGASIRFVVPLRIPMYADLGGLSMYGCVALEPGDADAIERDAWSRLDDAVRLLHGDGVQASGRVTCTDALSAVERELAESPADEIIVSLKARAISRWLGIDLATRLARRFPDVRVITVENRPVAAAAR